MTTTLMAKWKVNDEMETRIGNYVRISVQVFIEPAISIGDHAVIGANLVVTTDTDSFKIIRGVPATHIHLNREHYRFDGRQ